MIPSTEVCLVVLRQGGERREVAGNHVGAEEEEAAEAEAAGKVNTGEGRGERERDGYNLT